MFFKKKVDKKKLYLSIAMGVMACGVLAENNSTADKSYASAGDSGAIPLFAKANILPQNESSFPFNISKCNGRAELSFKCRIDFAKWAGHNYAFTIRVNGRDIGMKNIVGRPVSFKTADGKEIPAVRGNSLLCYYAPDADAIPECCQYKPVDPAFDALTYSVDISDCIFEGENQITFRNILATGKLKNELVLSKAEIIYQKGKGEKKQMDYGKLEVPDKKGLLLNYNGNPLIVSNNLTGFSDWDNAASSDAREKNSIKIWNVLRAKDEKLNFRRELALHPDGAAELTVKFWKASYTDGKRMYSFAVPFSALKGCKFTALVGRTYSTKQITGVIDDKFNDYIGGTVPLDRLIHYLAFESEKVHLVFDFNPYGVTQMYSDYPYTGEPMSIAKVNRAGNFLIFTLIDMKQGSGGGVYAAKTIIYPGVYDYDSRHPYQKWTYRGGPEPLAYYSFGTPAKIASRVEPEGDGPAARTGTPPPPKPPIGVRADLGLYAPSKAAGWEKAAGLQLTDNKSLNIFANAVYSSSGSPATFLIDVKPGIYVLTLKLGHPDSDIGPFDIMINGKPSVSDIRVSKGETETVLIPCYVRAPEKQISIQLQGKKQWAMNSIGVQTLLYQNEDFFWDRGLWLADGLFEPDFSVPGVARKKKSFVFEPKVVSRTAFQKSPYEYSSREKEILLPPNVPANAWRANMKMTVWADESHSATGFEFNTKELAERRVLELKAQGYNTINCASLFWNQGFTDRWDEAIAMTRLVCDAAHKYGLKVVYHMDGPVPLYHNTGLANMLSHLDWMQTDVQYGLPTFIHMNPNYPGFRDDFFERLVRLAKEANLDGYMIDELTYSSIKYSGDPATRKVFEAETGLRLPTDTSSPVWFNDDDGLWRQWIRWRQKNVGDWMLALRKELNKVNPNFTLFTYITHYGFTEPWANKEFGITIQEMGRSCDMVGTEIQSRNVFDAYRSVFALRKAKAALGDYLGSSVYGLVYPAGDPSIAYFGWALNYMNRQLTWSSLIPGANMQRYLDWPDQMVYHKSRSVSDAAILISASSRDFGKYMASFPDAHGASELLSDAHIQHDFIVEEDLNPAKLAGYKALFLCSVPCLSKKQVGVIRDFVNNGGILFATGHTSLLDENGKPLDHLQLADLFGADVESATTVNGLAFRKKATAEKISYPLSLIKVKLTNGGKGTVGGEMEDASGKSAGPGLIENAFGKGFCIYSPCQTGMVNFEKEHSAAVKWDYEKNSDWAKLFMSEVEKYLSPKLSFQAVQVPERVLVSVTMDKGSAPAEMRVHILNATGAAKLKKGDIVASKKAADSFPMLDKDIIFTIRQPGIQSATVVSPDYQGGRSVKIEDKGNDTYQFLVKKEDCRTFSDVIIKLK